MDKRIQDFANTLVNYCVSLQKGENLLISCTDIDAEPLVKAIIKEAYKVGANPFVDFEISTINRALMMGCNSKQMEMKFKNDYDLLKDMDANITIRGFTNAAEYSDVPDEKSKIMVEQGFITKSGRRNLKWVGLRYPSFAVAQLAGMSLEAYEDFHYLTCNMDYKTMSKNMEPLVDLMNKTDKVVIKGEGTDLSFSIKGITAIPCDGKVNIPDGEIFTAPVRNSINGHVTFNIPSVYESRTFENIYFEFVEGKIIKATSNYTEKLNQILNTDEGARYIGEFSFGVNPFITIPTNDGGIDEKLAGSIHITPGACYDEADNGNYSKIHWDLVLLQTKEYGGGEIYFDDVLIRKDGIFVIEELIALNP